MNHQKNAWVHPHLHCGFLSFRTLIKQKALNKQGVQQGKYQRYYGCVVALGFKRKNTAIKARRSEEEFSFIVRQR